MRLAASDPGTGLRSGPDPPRRARRSGRADGDLPRVRRRAAGAGPPSHGIGLRRRGRAARPDRGPAGRDPRLQRAREAAGLAQAGRGADVSHAPARRAPPPGDLDDAIEMALRELSPAIRAVVVLRFLDGLSHHAIAEALGISTNASEARLSRGIAALRRRLETLL